MIKKLLIILIRYYQRWISILLPPSCRFHPSCSAYCLVALKRHGVLKGGYLTIKRLLRCQPLFEGGYDPVP